MDAARIRRRFLDYFVERGHREVASSSLVPRDDPTLLFTNAGMVQFKRVFLGIERRDYKRATTSQKCVRAGGKHNDLEQVGHTDRHHTFFEMLGNFSFGDYFKKEAIGFAWEFVTSDQWLGIHPDRIRISVHAKDADARRLWHEVAGVADDRIYGLGDADNFWQMADTGPCGFCSEVYVDLAGTGARGHGGTGSGEHASDHIHSLDQFVEYAEAGRFLEIWNLVFMQFDRQASGELVPLPAPSVDTGAGLERIAAVLQGVGSNFSTDLFAPLIARAELVVGKAYDKGPAGAPFRVLADHARAVAFLLADGVYPSNEGRGYVLRRILRRAVRHAYLLGRREPTLVRLVEEVSRAMGGAYPELQQHAALLTEVTTAEEERFLETIEGGLERLAGLTAVSAEEAFKLYDTYGFPIDLTEIVAAERGIAVDVAGFEKLLDVQRERSRADRAAGAGSRTRTLAGPKGRTRAVGREDPEGPRGSESGGAQWVSLKKRSRQKWIGYETTRAETDILAFEQEKGRVGLILHENPFYAESGGQVSDTGEVVGQGWKLPVDEVRKVEGKTAVFGPFHGPFEPTAVEAVVDQRLRRDTERNHTATHLLHAALRKILGTHVRQAGSVVSPEHLRFDFTHHQPIPPLALAEIEAEINQHVWENLDVVQKEMAYADALALGRDGAVRREVRRRGADDHGARRLDGAVRRLPRADHGPDRPPAAGGRDGRRRRRAPRRGAHRARRVRLAAGARAAPGRRGGDRGQRARASDAQGRDAGRGAEEAREARRGADQGGRRAGGGADHRRERFARRRRGLRFRRPERDRRDGGRVPFADALGRAGGRGDGGAAGDPRRRDRRPGGARRSRARPRQPPGRALRREGGRPSALRLRGGRRRDQAAGRGAPGRGRGSAGAGGKALMPHPTPYTLHPSP